MYKIESVIIDGFWHRYTAKSKFNSEVNIIIGENGTGKTTFMNILHSVLSVDIDGINNSDFESIEIRLAVKGKKRTVKAKKIESDHLPFVFIEYQISRKNFRVRLISSEDRPRAMVNRRRYQEELDEVKNVLGSIVSLSSISVYRLRNDDEYEVRDRHGSRVIAPVDSRLQEVLRGLTHYQLSVSQNAREISTRLQKDVLTSILYEEDDTSQTKIALDFSKDTEKSRLISAYTQLNAINPDVTEKISFHVNSIDSSLTELAQKIKDKNGHESVIKNPANTFRSLEAFRKTRKIIELSLTAEKKTDDLFSQLNLFLDTVKSFIKEKDFIFNKGDLIISNSQGKIPHDRLSSGEKQLLILLTEALLQNQDPHIFLADEPELSLHIEWQRMVVPAIRMLNPNAQVIAATHSPEVASKYREYIIDMEEIIHG